MQERRNTEMSFIEENKLFIFLFTILVSGILVGVITFRSFDADVIESLTLSAQNFAEERMTSTFTDILTDSFFSSSILILVTFICGFCSISQPVEFLIPFYKGLGLGACTAQIYSANGISGILTVLLLIVPCASVTCFAVLAAAKESIRYSNKYFIRAITSRHICGMAYYTKAYCIRYMFFEIIIAFGALTDAVCTHFFASIVLK